MRTCRLVPLVALAALPAVACGTDSKADQPASLAATLTADQSACLIRTAGFTPEPGEVRLRFTNKHAGPVTIEVVSSSGSVVASAPRLAADQSAEQVVHLDEGTYTTRCSNGAVTWTSAGEGKTPAGIIMAGSVRSFNVGT